MTKQDRLASYRAKRDSSASPEPAGSEPRGNGGSRFVVQRHDASTLHFDVRLEVGGVLVSWSVPIGPSTDPRDKRLAVRTEDHPLDYADFEGRIPAGEYGGGSVVIWDTGAFENITQRRGTRIGAADALAHGHLVVRLQGDRLSDGYALTRFRTRESRENWLLVKENDEAADRHGKPARTPPESVVSGRSNAEVAEDG
jgi:DNA ligase D-like protein (predicted 3'-phosphoesterase)